jgi:hypothetical protein
MELCMKRIREFNVSLCSVDGGTTLQHVSGWHKAWELAEQAMHDNCVEGRISDAGNKKSPIIAIFSHHNMQDELVDIDPVAVKTRWRSEPLGNIHGAERFANTNVTDFGWSWVEGAKRDLPFRLSYLERSAERNPNGLFAYMLGLKAEAADLFRKG